MIRFQIAEPPTRSHLDRQSRFRIAALFFPPPGLETAVEELVASTTTSVDDKRRADVLISFFRKTPGWEQGSDWQPVEWEVNS